MTGRTGPLAALLLAAIVAYAPLHGVGALRHQPVGAWIAVVLAVLYAAGPGARAARLGWQGPTRPWSRAEGLGVAVLLGLAAFLRLFRLGELPAWLDYDSVQNGWIGLELVARWQRDGHYQAVLREWASGNESAFMYLTGLSLGVLGHGAGALCLPAALAGIATVGAVYRLARRLHGPSLAQTAAFLVAIAPWHIQMSREAKQPVCVPLFVALALEALLAGLDAPQRGRRLAALACCGLALGAGLHFYEASRAVPLAVAAILLAEGWVGRRLLAALRELVWVAGAAALVASPLLIEAFADPGNFMMHVSSNAVWSRVAEERSLWPLLDNIAVTLGHLVFVLPRELAGTDWLPSAHAALPALVLAGAVGLAQGPPRTRRVLALLAFVMAAPVVLPRYDLTAPRRYGGELVPLYLCAAAAAVGLLRALRERWGRRAAALVAALGAGALASELPVVFESLALPPPWLEPAAAIEQRRLRWAAEAARDQHVVLTGRVDRDDYFVHFYLRHPGISAVPAGWPLPAVPLDRPLLVLGAEGPAERLLVDQLGARALAISLRDPQGQLLATETALQLDAARLRTHRAERDGCPTGWDGWLVVTEPGEYRFAPTEGLELGGAPCSGPVALSWGAHRLRYAPGAPATLSWTGPAGAGPVPAGRLWRGLELPAAPALARPEREALAWQRVDVPVAPSHEFNRALQDVEPDGAGGYWLLDLDRDPLKRWDPPSGRLEAVPLWHRDGTPWRGPLRYRNLRLGLFSLARAGSVLFVLDREARRVYRCAGDRLEPLELPGPVEIADLAAAEGALVLADPAGGALWEVALDAAGRAGLPRRVLSAAPVSVALGEGVLVHVDAVRCELVVHAWPVAGEPRRVRLLHAGPGQRVSVGHGGRIALADGERRALWAFDAQLRLLAPRGEPDLARTLARPRDVEPVAAAFGPDALVILGRHELLVWTEGRDPAERPGFDLAVREPEAGNLRVADGGPSAGLLIDRGQWPAWARWPVSALGRHEVWLLYATNDARPLELVLDEQVVARSDPPLTGGYTRPFLRWHCLGEIDLPGRRCQLGLRSRKDPDPDGGYLPHLDRLRLVSVAR